LREKKIGKEIWATPILKNAQANEQPKMAKNASNLVALLFADFRCAVEHSNPIMAHEQEA
jgi:hypothetical protein